MTTVIQHLRRAVMARDTTGMSDGQLLDCFLMQREEAAFAALVRRHGNMVLGVCRRILANPHDAEDAFQATFLVLVRKAASIQPRDRVGPWLHGVALRTASKARGQAVRRQVVERHVNAARSHDLPSEEGLWRDLRPLLDAELQRLPETYRAPVLLCDLEGASRGEAARRLGVPEGTISSRLARGREMLGKRLRRRGVTLAVGGLALMLTKQAAAALPRQLLETTIANAASGAPAPVVALAEGVMHAMIYSKFKFVAAVLAVASVVSLGLGAGAHRALAERSQPAVVASAEAEDKADKAEVGPTISGVIAAVDAAKKILTLRVNEDPNKKTTTEHTYILPKEAKIQLQHGLKKEQMEGTVDDLIFAATVSVQLSTDKKTAVSVTVQPGNVEGVLTSVDEKKNSLTVSTTTVSAKGEKLAEEKTIKLLPEARIVLDDGHSKKGDPQKEGKFADLREGLVVRVRLFGYDRTQGVEVNASGPSLRGTIKAVDIANSTITLTMKQDGQLVDKTLTLMKDVKINGGQLNDLTADTNVSLRLSVLDRDMVVGIQVFKE